MAWQNPKTDWVANPKNPVPEDFNRIEGNIDFLKQDIETKKGLIVDAINDMNQPAQVTDTHAQLASKIRDISKDATAAVGDVEKGKTFYAGGQKRTGTLELTGDAGSGDVLTGKTFYNTDLKTKRTGTMPNRGAVIITPSTSNQTIQAGYHNGQGYVKGDSNLVPANIAEGKTVFGVQGTANSFRDQVLHLYMVDSYTLKNIFEVGIQEGDATVSIDEAGVIIYSSNNNYGSAVTKTSYNLTPYNYLVIFGYWYGYFTVTFDIVTSKTAGKDDYIRKYTLNEYDLNQHVYDIGSLSGDYYFRIGGARNASGRESARIISTGIILV